MVSAPTDKRCEVSEIAPAQAKSFVWIKQSRGEPTSRKKFQLYPESRWNNNVKVFPKLKQCQGFSKIKPQLLKNNDKVFLQLTLMK